MPSTRKQMNECKVHPNGVTSTEAMDTTEPFVKITKESISVSDVVKDNPAQSDAPPESALSSDESSPDQNSSHCLSPKGVTHEILKYSSIKGVDKLFGSDGHSYMFYKNKQDESRVWRCAVKSGSMMCAATVHEKNDGTFSEKKVPHCHPPDPYQFAVAQIKRKLKHKAVKYPSKSAATMARKIVQKYIPDDAEFLKTHSVKRFARMATRHRRIMQQRALAGNVDEHKEFRINKHKTKKKRSHSSADKSSNGIHHSTPALPAQHLDSSDEFFPVYLPKKIFEKMFNGLPNLINQDTGKVAHCNSTTINPKRTETIISEVFRQHNAMSPSSQPDDIPSISGYGPFPVIAESKPDADEMYFNFLAAEIKELPKLTRSRLKSEIMSLVYSAMQNNAG